MKKQSNTAPPKDHSSITEPKILKQIGWQKHISKGHEQKLLVAQRG